MKKKDNRLVYLVLSIILVAVVVGNVTMTMKSIAELSRAKETIREQEGIINELYSDMAYLKDEWMFANNAYDELERQYNEALVTIDELKNTSKKMTYLGNFKITYYCKENYPHICNNGDSTYTASGTPSQAGVTIAVNRKQIPFGSEVFIDGIGWRIAQDVGGGIGENRIDVMVETHAEALQLGVTYRDVWVAYG